MFKMHKLGNILAFIFNKLFALILVASILVFVPVMAYSTLVKNPETIKTILSESDVYNTVPDNIIDIVALEDEEDNNDQNEVGADLNKSPNTNQDFDKNDQEPAKNSDQMESQEPTKTIRQVLEENQIIDPDKLITTVKTAIGVEFLQAQVEGLIDSTYRFADGTDEELSFSFSLKDRREIAAEELKKFANESFADLEACTEIEQVDKEFDILESTCLPAGLDLDAEINTAVDELTGDDSIFGETFTQADLDIPSDVLSSIKLGYETLTKINLIAWLLILGLVVVVIMTSKTVHRGFKESGILLAVNGAVLILVSIILRNVVDITDIVQAEGNTAAQQESISNIAKPLADNLIGNLTGSILITSIIIVGLGIVLYIIGYQLTKRQLEHLYLPFHFNKDKEDSSKSVDTNNETAQDNVSPTKEGAKKIDSISKPNPAASKKSSKPSA